MYQLLKYDLHGCRIFWRSIVAVNYRRLTWSEIYAWEVNRPRTMTS